MRLAAESSGARARRPRRRRIAIAIAVGIAVALIIGGVALATGFNPLRVLWPTNEHGQTYGTGTAQPWPDLVAVASDGKKGYCYKTDLNGPSPMPTTRRAEEDLVTAGIRGYAIPKYGSDGTTQIGVFWIGGGAGGGKSGAAASTRRPPTRTARSSRRRRPPTARSRSRGSGWMAARPSTLRPTTLV